MSFDRLILLSDVYTSLIGLTAFCTYIKAIKYLQLNPHVAELAATLQISGKGEGVAQALGWVSKLVRLTDTYEL